MFKISPTGKLHVHGVIVPPLQTEADMKLLREALAKAGGKIKGKGAARQVDVSDIEDGFGWAAYCVFCVLAKWSKNKEKRAMAGEPGFEPGLTESESQPIY